MAIIYKIKFCECGCGEVVKKKWATGHHRKNVSSWNKGLTKKTDIRVKKYSKSLTGIPHSEERRKKNSQVHLGQVAWNKGLDAKTDKRVKKYSRKRQVTWKKKQENGEIIAWNKGISTGSQSPENIAKRVASRAGYRHSEEVKAKIKATNIKTWSRSEIRSKTSGKNSSSWRGGISKEPYSQDWTKDLKESIRKRDNYTCRLCTIPQSKLRFKLDVHHIDYDKENCDPKNLISLCQSCHRKTNSNRSKWISFFGGEERIKLNRRKVA